MTNADYSVAENKGKEDCEMVKDLIKFVGLCLAIENNNNAMVSSTEEILTLNKLMDEITADKNETKKAA